MNRNKFDEEMKRLHMAFGTYPYGGKGELVDAAMRRYVDKIAEWFGLWQRFYRETADVVLTKMVDQSITGFDRPPSFAQFRGLRESALRTLPRQGYAAMNCYQCNNDGVLWAWRDVPNYGHASYAFRCDRCMNWQGKCDGLPSWAGQEAFGYKPGIIQAPKNTPAPPPVQVQVDIQEHPDEVPF